MECSFCFIAILTAFLGLMVYYFSKKNLKAPPGPVGLPIVGSLFSVGTAPHLKFSKWAKQYGPVFSVKIGAVRAVVLNDAKSFRDAFREDAFSGRPDNKFFLQLSGGEKGGVAFSEGQMWIEQRRFALRSLRDLGFGKNSMESIIMTEVDEFIDWLKKEVGQPVSLNRKFSLAILNSVWMILCGHRYRHDDPELKKISDTGSAVLNESVKSGFLVFMHGLTKIAPELSGWNRFLRAMKSLTVIMEEEIKEHDQSFIETNPPRDFVDIFLANIKATTDPNSTFFKDEGYRQLKAGLLDFFGAGSETTSATLTWSVLYLATNPKVQKKMQDEIDQIVGKNRQPTLADKPKLPYTEAVMQEVLRMSSIVPSGLFHSTTKNVTFRGFEIPKDTYIIGNIHGVHHDPDIWDEPESFRPERFLSEDGKTAVSNENLLAFSTGKRSCIGENLARDEFFLFLANIFQRFEVIPDRPISEISMEPELGFILQPQKFQVILKDRLE